MNKSVLNNTISKCVERKSQKSRSGPINIRDNDKDDIIEEKD